MNTETMLQVQRLLRPQAQDSPGRQKLFHTMQIDTETLEKLFQATNGWLLEVVARAGQEALRCSGPGWYPESDLSVSGGGRMPFQLRLVGFKRLEISVNQKLLMEAADRLQPQTELESGFGVIEEAVGALVSLFASYYRHCPKDGWRHGRLVDAALIGGYGTYWVRRSEEQLAVSVASFFETLLAAPPLIEIEKERILLGLAYEKVLNQHSAHLLSSLNQRAQALLFPAHAAAVQSIVPSEPDPVADALLPHIFSLVFSARVRTFRGVSRMRGRMKVPQSWNWPAIVEKLAALLIPYLERESTQNPPTPNPFASPGGHDAVPGDGGLNCVPGDSGSPCPVDELAAGEQSDSVNPFGDMPGTDRNDSGSSSGGRGMGIGGGRPRYLMPFEDLDARYTEEASELRILDDDEDERTEEEPELITVGYLDCEEGSLIDLVRGNVEFLRTRLSEPDDDGIRHLRVFRRIEPLEIAADGPDPGDENPPPNLALMVDSSGSMAFKPQATDPNGRGAYHLVLMACWGIFRHLENYLGRSRDPERLRLCALNFSGRTLSSGWHSGADIERIKRVIAAYQGGGTTLDLAALRRVFDESQGNVLAIMMTDGGISNGASIAQLLHEQISRGHKVALLHIGQENSFTQSVAEIGGHVRVLKNAQDLVGISLDLARDTYNHRDATARPAPAASGAPSLNRY